MHNETDRQLAAELTLRAESSTGLGTAEWIDQTGSARVAIADARLLDEELYLAQPVRTGNRYPRQRNYHGWYLFSQTRQHVWFESRLERSRLASIDHYSEILAVASQPMQLTFADNGSTHFPDLIALHSNNRQVLYDIKPRDRMTDKVLDQFARTKAMCDQIGWGYSVLNELDPFEKVTINWLRAFKHPGFHPGEEAVNRLMEYLPAPLRTAATITSPADISAGRSAIFHLLWTRELIADTSQVLGDLTMVEAPDA